MGTTAARGSYYKLCVGVERELENRGFDSPLP